MDSLIHNAPDPSFAIQCSVFCYPSNCLDTAFKHVVCFKESLLWPWCLFVAKLYFMMSNIRDACLRNLHKMFETRHLISYRMFIFDRFEY